jgi:hypothetical protein
MANVDLGIGIGAEYKGRGAFNKANKDIFGLQKGVKQLAKAYIGLAGAQKVFRYGQQSLQAFAQDDLAAQKLAKTVGNLGLAYEATNVENFIQGLEKTFHVADDLLRPAFARLIQVTGSYTKSKELLTTALNASAGAGVDLTTTVQDLSQAYVGNLKGLKKYNLGLTNAELATMSFQQIQDKLDTTFSGQAAISAATYAGQINALSIAAGNAKEVIGKGLVDALTTAAGKKGDIDGLVQDMETLANAAANVVRFVGAAANIYSKIGFGIANIFGYSDKPKQKAKPYDPMSAKTEGLSAQQIKNIQARAKVDREAAKRQKELAALMTKQTKALKEQTALAKAKAVLEKASAVMDMDLIQNTAALQGKVTENETLRLNLQREILLGNSEAAAKLAQELLGVQLAAVMAANVDPFGKFNDSAMLAMDSIKKMREELAKLGTPTVTPAQLLLANDYVNVLKDAQDISYLIAQDETQAALDGLLALKDLPSIESLLPKSSPYSPTTGNFTYGQGNPLNVKVFVDPSAMAYGISAAVIDNNANGNSNTYSTIQSFAGGM